METVRDVMSRNVECVEPQASLRTAARIMRDRDFGSLPVCENRQVLGIVTDRDIAVRAVASGLDADRTPVNEIMSREVVSVRETAYLGDAERIMRDRQLRRLPVLNQKGELVGYLAMARIARTEEPVETGRVLRGVSQASGPVQAGSP
ncbi:MAG TPA: CBS domain-containing protein [Planctomycetota bacterium]|nr:CBS domain-containing protein [Planctomycetota bacterium]